MALAGGGGGGGGAESVVPLGEHSVTLHPCQKYVFYQPREADGLESCGGGSTRDV